MQTRRAMIVIAALLAAPGAHADWRDHGRNDHPRPERPQYARPQYEHRSYDRPHGPGIAGALLGLGAAAIIGGALASQSYVPPPIYYAPPPVPYVPPPTYYAPPPVTYLPAPQPYDAGQADPAEE